ncbi:TetR/AcrR family transcriptional regulator [Actinoplanes sp. NPDC051851]|uniref:TetR/AcrR family transcriptional regulator n=1 Tax=Actinoplanes sp. NPDC051851 TaxID=3154753 RepID=UPI003444B632
MSRVSTTQPGAARGPYTKGIERRKEILERTLEVYAERGFSRTSMSAIGEAIGVSHAALKHYFPSRDALLLEVLRERDEQMRRQVLRDDDPTSLAHIPAAGEANTQVPGLVALYSSMAASSTEAGNETAREFFTDRFAAAREDFATRIAADQQAGRIRADIDPHVIASLVLAASDGLQIQWSLDTAVSIREGLTALLQLLQVSPD